MNKITINEINVAGKKVLVRVDFNVPLDKDGRITDDNRMRAVLPTIEYLVNRGARVVIASHLGRPDGKVVDKLRLGVVAQRLSQIISKPVRTTLDCIGSEAEEAAASLKNGDVLLLDNLRFHAEEEENDPLFARSLAGLVDIYVNDAFGTAHRKHASIVGVTEYLPAVAGLLLEKELQNLGVILEEPAHPFAGLFGGAKVSDKVALLENIMDKVDILLIGGGMAATFLKAKSYEVGRSLVEMDKLSTAKDLIGKAVRSRTRLLLPLDVVVIDEISDREEVNAVSIENILSQQRIADIGEQTIKSFSQELKGCQTVFWNGTMGISEISEFASGTKAMTKLLAGLNITSIIGGGSTAEAVAELGLTDEMTFVSTGGGASLSFLGGQKLPGVEALLDRDSPAAEKLR